MQESSEEVGNDSWLPPPPAGFRATDDGGGLIEWILWRETEDYLRVVEDARGEKSCSTLFDAQEKRKKT